MSDTPKKDPLDRYRVAAALLLLIVFAALVAVMIVRADDGNEVTWAHLVYVFGAVEAIVFTAVGWFFGKEVHREAAEKAREDADASKADAAKARDDAGAAAAEAADSKVALAELSGKQAVIVKAAQGVAQQPGLQGDAAPAGARGGPPPAHTGLSDRELADLVLRSLQP
jgi:hypothetical protein